MRKIREIEKNVEPLEKIEETQSQHVYIIKMNILSKFHEESITFYEFRGHTLILPFLKAQTRAVALHRILFFSIAYIKNFVLRQYNLSTRTR